MTLPDTMGAMVTMGHGELDQLVWHPDWPRPEPADGEVLIRVRACGLNNTDVNTRSGWYSKTVTDPATNAVPVNSSLSDAELATFSCSYSTAEGMLTRAEVTAADTVLVPGASGGVGGALGTFYLRDLTFTGSTVIDPIVTRRLVQYIEAGDIQPALAATYPLQQLREAQAAFIAKQHTGNIVVTV